MYVLKYSCAERFDLCSKIIPNYTECSIKARYIDLWFYYIEHPTHLDIPLFLADFKFKKKFTVDSKKYQFVATWNRRNQ